MYESLPPRPSSSLLFSPPLLSTSHLFPLKNVLHMNGAVKGVIGRCEWFYSQEPNVILGCHTFLLIRTLVCSSCLPSPKTLIKMKHSNQHILIAHQGPCNWFKSFQLKWNDSKCTKYQISLGPLGFWNTEISYVEIWLVIKMQTVWTNWQYTTYDATNHNCGRWEDCGQASWVG